MKVLIRRLPFVFVNVFLDLFLGDGSNRGTKIASRPQVLTPVSFLQMLEFFLQLAGRDAFDELNNFGWRQQRWTRHQDMHVIDAHMTFHNADVAAHTHLLDDVARSFGHLGAQHMVAIFRGPYKVVLDVIDGVSTFAILWHDYPRPVGGCG